jgi:NADPH-dependent 2,4-dienoyl-CoA reductase/sulfur reductase-like enzyme
MPHPGDPISYRGADILNNSSYPGLMSRIRDDLVASQHQSNGLCAFQEEDMLRRTFRKDTKPHVCIIGAGFAGLRCADILLQHDIQVTVFEARNRIGGRVSLLPENRLKEFTLTLFQLYQEKVGGHLIDL